MYWFVALLLTASVFGQDPALARLKQELKAAREHEEHHQENEAARLVAVHAALRDWIETRLPRDVSLPGETSALEASLRSELIRTRLSAADSAGSDFNPDDPGFDQVGLDLKMMPGLPNMLFVTAMVKVPCGGDEAVYAYRFDSNGRARVIEDHPKRGGYGNTKFELSDPDSQGRRLLLIDRWSVQCQSTWMGMTYGLPAELLATAGIAALVRTWLLVGERWAGVRPEAGWAHDRISR